MRMKDMPANVIRVFVDWWGKLHDMVLWKDKLPESFLFGSGVPQGCLLVENF